jgi:hypothetical protein
MIVRTNNDDRNQDEADRLRSHRTTATTVAIVSDEADRSHPVASITFDLIKPVSIDRVQSPIAHEYLPRLYPVHYATN